MALQAFDKIQQLFTILSKLGIEISQPEKGPLLKTYS